MNIESTAEEIFNNKKSPRARMALGDFLLGVTFVIPETGRLFR